MVAQETGCVLSVGISVAAFNYNFNFNVTYFCECLVAIPDASGEGKRRDEICTILRKSVNFSTRIVADHGLNPQRRPSNVGYDDGDYLLKNNVINFTKRSLCAQAVVAAIYTD